MNSTQSSTNTPSSAGHETLHSQPDLVQKAPVKRPIKSTWKRLVFDVISDALIGGFRLNRPSRIYQALMSRIDVVKEIDCNGTRLLFDANKELHLWRAQVFTQKEPDTIEWINSFNSEDVFLDVGANVGVFSLYAAAHRRCDVFAFEPESQNFACLNKNIFLNSLSRKIHPFNVGLDESTSVSEIYLEKFQSGGANHSVGAAINVKGEQYSATYSQTVLAYSFDTFREQFNLPIPHHIKIDVDGNEGKVLRGMRETIHTHQVRSICIELRESDVSSIEFIRGAGFEVLRKTRYESIVANGAEDYLSNFIFSRVQ